MSAVPFDTLKLADRLQGGGFSAEQAKATSSALADALSDGLATDIRALKSDGVTMKADIGLLKWMVAFVLAFQIGAFVKLFIH